MESSKFTSVCSSVELCFFILFRKQNQDFFSLLLFRDVSKFAMHFIVEEIDEDTSMEELQKMMLVALVYRILVCFYEVSFLHTLDFKTGNMRQNLIVNLFCVHFWKSL